MGLAASMILTGVAVVAPSAASASPGYHLYTKWSGAGKPCKKGTKAKAYDTVIPRHKYDERHVKMIFGIPTGYSYARQRAFNLARVEAVCSKRYATGPNNWQWWQAYYGLERGKVSRLKQGKHTCSRSGTCGSAHSTKYGTWRAGWTHFKM
ncbi:hypothetical protein E1295_32775 [Nonomuraea mesophila]|uniref:Uncharacterized protein n=1 Tax=Nonomuraea mesophila TaxID=2530382 RepID=A0A4R5EXA5_9ACTN|nr:hypothetical protein [Nonomuraea mesophila]TDE39500.1 hypothetical protein E1295_32775 [Nonomuraea mesophila]